MSALKGEQRRRALEVLSEYLGGAPGADGKTPVELGVEWDEKRVTVIKEEMKPLLHGYLEGRVELDDFKSKVDSVNKRHPLWGFKGIKGQMFFNMMVNVADDKGECDQELKAALPLPSSDQIASSRMKTFAGYVRRVGDQWADAGNRRYGCPKVGSVPFFLSYFWHIQDRETWPVYYTNTVNTMTDLNLWESSGNLAEDYLSFKDVHQELTELFSSEAGRPFSLYDVEHVFWFKGGNPYELAKQETTPKSTPEPLVHSEHELLPDSYVPPIIAILPPMGRHEEGLSEIAARSGTTLERAFEKYIDAALTMLGYECRLLGQGKGRVPDGVAVALDDSYAILWDAKIRAGGYSIGTDDRTIREYITTQSRDLKRRRSLRNIYYLIISSTFADDFDDTIRSIKMETDVSEVSLVQADALVAMVDAKLRAPLQITLGPDGMQRLFSVSGVISAEIVREQL